MTPEELEFVRRYVGLDDPTDEEIAQKFVLYDGYPVLVAKSIVQTRLTTMAQGASSFSVPGYSESNAASMKVWQDILVDLAVFHPLALIDELLAVSSDAEVGTVTLKRVGRSR